MLQTLAPYLALAAVIVALALAVALLMVLRSLNRLRADQRTVLGKRERRDLVEHAVELEERVQNLREAVTILSDEVESYRRDLDGSLSNIAMVRFDAFRDTGGQQSASVALLDRYRSGVVFSVIMSREFSRLYTKYLDHGIPDRELAPEEAAAVERAVPRPLQRGELSHSPVPSFPRALREKVTHQHERPEALVLPRDDEETQANLSFVPQDLDALGQTHLEIGSDDDGLPHGTAGGSADSWPEPASRPESPQADLGFTWVEAERQDGEARQDGVARQDGEATGAERAGETVGSGAAAEADAAKGASAAEETGAAAETGATPVAAVAAGDDPFGETQALERGPHSGYGGGDLWDERPDAPASWSTEARASWPAADPAGPVAAPDAEAPVNGDAAQQVNQAPGADDDSSEREGKHAPGGRGRTRRDDDWLGGDELDF